MLFSAGVPFRGDYFAIDLIASLDWRREEEIARQYMRERMYS